MFGLTEAKLRARLVSSDKRAVSGSRLVARTHQRWCRDPATVSSRAYPPSFRAGLYLEGGLRAETLAPSGPRPGWPLLARWNPT